MNEECRYRELIKYVAAQSINDPFFGRTKLNKILFFCDFLAYRDLGKSISGDTYVKQPYGPVPTHIEKVFKQLIDTREMAVSVGVLGAYVQNKPVALKTADLGLFTPQEISLIDHIIVNLWNSTAKDVSDLSHEFVGWSLAGMGEVIPYETVLLKESEVTPEDIEYGKTLLQELDLKVVAV